MLSHFYAHPKQRDIWAAQSVCASTWNGTRWHCAVWFQLLLPWVSGKHHLHGLFDAAFTSVCMLMLQMSFIPDTALKWKRVLLSAENCHVPYGENNVCQITSIQAWILWRWPWVWCWGINMHIWKLSLNRSTHEAKFCFDGWQNTPQGPEPEFLQR